MLRSWKNSQFDDQKHCTQCPPGDYTPMVVFYEVDICNDTREMRRTRKANGLRMCRRCGKDQRVLCSWFDDDSYGENEDAACPSHASYTVFHTYSVDQDEDLCPGLDAKGNCKTTGLVRTHFRGQGRTFEQTTRKSTLLQFPKIYRVKMKGSAANQFLDSAAHKQPFGGVDTNGLTQRKGMKDMDRRPPAHGVNLEPLAHIRLNVKETAPRKRGSDHLGEEADDDSASPKRVKFEANDMFHPSRHAVLGVARPFQPDTVMEDIQRADNIPNVDEQDTKSQNRSNISLYSAQGRNMFAFHLGKIRKTLSDPPMRTVKQNVFIKEEELSDDEKENIQPQTRAKRG